MIAPTPEAPVITLECQIAAPGERINSATPWDLKLVISTRHPNVIATGPHGRTSTTAVSITPTEWQWGDWRGGALGDSSVNRRTLRYEAVYGERRLVGWCRHQVSDR